MDDAALLIPLGWIVCGAAACMVMARFIRLPSIVACLIAGVILGPLLGVVDDTMALKLISEMGIVLLLFLVGMELSFDKVREVGPVAVAAGLGQVVFTAALGWVMCMVLGFSIMESVFLAVGLTFSSTVVVVKLLTDKNELNTLYGRIAIGIFLVQDLVVILVLTALTGLAGAGDWQAGATIDWRSLATSIGYAFGGMLLLLGVVLVAARWVLPCLFAIVASSPPTTFIWSLGWCFAVVGLAYGLSLSVELGAFFAGLSLAQLPYHRDLQHRIKPLMNFFVAVFFVSLGLKISPEGAMQEWAPIFALSLFVLLGNPLIFMVIITRMGYGERTAFFTSVTVAQISEFSFIFAGMGVAAGLVGERIMVITAMVGVLTIAASAYMILYNQQCFDWCRQLGLLRPFRAKPDDPVDKEQLEAPGLTGHIIIVGMNALGRQLCRDLHEQGEKVLGVDTDKRKLTGLPCPTLLGSAEYLGVLLEAGLPEAKLLISALRIEEANELLAFRSRQFGVPCAIHAVDTSVLDNLLDLDVSYLMLSKVDGIKLQNRLLKEKGILPS